MNLRRHILLLRWLLPAVLLLAGSWRAGAQIVNRLKVDANTFQRYAYGRMQPYHSDNLALEGVCFVIIQNFFDRSCFNFLKNLCEFSAY